MNLTYAWVFAMDCLYSHSTFAIDHWQYKLDTGYGKRMDDLQYQLDGLLTGPASGEITEVTKADVSIYELQLGYRFIADDAWYVKGYFDQGWVYSGTDQQVSYSTSSPGHRWSHFARTGVRGSTKDTSIAFGHQYRWQDRVAVTPLAGYSQHQQNWRFGHAEQIWCRAGGEQTCLLTQGQTSTDTGNWHSNWRGPWFGLDLRASSGGWTMLLEWEHHMAYYDASLHWQGEQSLSTVGKISQTGRAQGNRLGLGLSYWLQNGYLNINFNVMDWCLNNGHHTVQPAAGAGSTQDLLQGRWQSQVWSLGYTTRF